MVLAIGNENLAAIGYNRKKFIVAKKRGITQFIFIHFTVDGQCIEKGEGSLVLGGIFLFSFLLRLPFLFFRDVRLFFPIIVHRGE